VRLYAELLDATGKDDHRARRDFYSMLIAELEPQGAPAVHPLT
jgi:hypothetical protein